VENATDLWSSNSKLACLTSSINLRAWPLSFLFWEASVTDDEFRQRAVECRQVAATVTNPLDKAFWLRLAEDWMNIAAQAEKIPGHDAPSRTPDRRRGYEARKWQTSAIR
jgi:hypothetical protein